MKTGNKRLRDAMNKTLESIHDETYEGDCAIDAFQDANNRIREILKQDYPKNYNPITIKAWKDKVEADARRADALRHKEMEKCILAWAEDEHSSWVN